jgi:hypothetical protein
MRLQSPAVNSFYIAGCKLRDLSSLLGVIEISFSFESFGHSLSELMFEKHDRHRAAGSFSASELVVLKGSSVDTDKLLELLEKLSKFAREDTIMVSYLGPIANQTTLS